MVFVPGLTAAEAVALLRAPADWRDQQEDVLESKLLWRDGDRSRVYLKLVRKKIVTVTYNTEHEVVYERRGPGRWTSRYFNPLLYVATTNTGSTDFLVFTTTTSGFSLPTGACAR